MKRKSKIWNGIIAGSFSALVASPALSVEIITKEDIVNNVVKKAANQAKNRSVEINVGLGE